MLLPSPWAVVAPVAPCLTRLMRKENLRARQLWVNFRCPTEKGRPDISRRGIPDTVEEDGRQWRRVKNLNLRHLPSNHPKQRRHRLLLPPLVRGLRFRTLLIRL